MQSPNLQLLSFYDTMHKYSLFIPLPLATHSLFFPELHEDLVEAIICLFLAYHFQPLVKLTECHTMSLTALISLYK